MAQIRKAIACIGNGFVGGSLTTCLAERGIDVYVYDKEKKLAFGGKDRFGTEGKQFTGVTDLVLQCEKHADKFSGIYFVCLPTPMNADGSCDVSIVEGVLDELSKPNGERVAVVKSTVPPGTTARWNKKYEGTGLRVVFNPEFLREATALDDMRNQDRIILGGPRPHINKVKQLFERTFPGVQIKKTSSTTAECVKYVTNIHLATKVALANEFYQVITALDKRGMDVDYDKVIEYATLDKRLGNSHWAVPGPMPADDTGEPAFGFGGSCFVKDLNALIAVARSIGIDPKVMSAAWEKNLEVRPQRDWEKLIGRAVVKSDKKNS